MKLDRVRLSKELASSSTASSSLGNVSVILVEPVADLGFVGIVMAIRGWLVMFALQGVSELSFP